MMNTDNTNTSVYILNFIIIGNSNVGKSTMMLQFTEKNFINLIDATIGVEYGAREISIDNKRTKIIIWDTAGQERYRAVTRSYYRNICCAILVYDITNHTSFESVNDWLMDIKQLSYDPVIILIGNKSDLHDRRMVSYEEGDNLAKQHNMLFFETSGKSNDVINDVFTKAAQTVMIKVTNSQIKINDLVSGVKYCDDKTKNIDKNNMVTMRDNTKDNLFSNCC